MVKQRLTRQYLSVLWSDFAIKHKGHCEGPQDNPCGAVPCEESRYPICASDGMTYVSIEAMWCAARHATKRKFIYYLC